MNRLGFILVLVSVFAFINPCYAESLLFSGKYEDSVSSSEEINLLDYNGVLLDSVPLRPECMIKGTDKVYISYPGAQIYELSNNKKVKDLLNDDGSIFIRDIFKPLLVNSVGDIYVENRYITNDCTVKKLHFDNQDQILVTTPFLPVPVDNEYILTLCMDTNENLYVVYKIGDIPNYRVDKLTLQGERIIVAYGTNLVGISGPNDITVDNKGNLYISVPVSTSANRIDVVYPDSVTPEIFIDTSNTRFLDLVTDSSGNLFFTESVSGSFHAVKMATPDGLVSTVLSNCWFNEYALNTKRLLPLDK